jgi:hypothetical protein
MCYRFEVRHYSNPTFKTIGTSYLLTMEHSPRRPQYLAQLNRFRPTARVVVLHNKGFKKCRKPSWVKNSALDLWHANFTALGVHFECDASPVLILEDDVEFFDCFFELAPKVERFVATRANLELYSLGSIAYLSRPVGLDHFWMRCGAVLHAGIYTRRGARKMLALTPAGLHDLKVIWTLNSYAGTRPCATQKILLTENSRLWNVGGAPVRYMRLFGDALFPVHHRLGMVGGLLPLVVAAGLVAGRRCRVRRASSLCGWLAVYVQPQGVSRGCL